MMRAGAPDSVTQLEPFRREAFFADAHRLGRGEPALQIGREQLINLLRESVVRNPTILGAYIGWEPNAIDHNDAAYVNSPIIGMGADGRFIP